MRRAYLFLSVTLILLLFLPIYPVDSLNTQPDNQAVPSINTSAEESFTVTPIPFWTVAGTKPVTFSNQTVVLGESLEESKHPDSIDYFNETIPDDVLFYPDMFFNDTVYLATSGEGGPIESGTYEDTFTINAQYLEGEHPTTGVAYVIINFTLPTDNIYVEGFLVSSLMQSTSNDVDFDIYDWDTDTWDEKVSGINGHIESWTNYSEYEREYWGTQVSIRFRTPSMMVAGVYVDCAQITYYVLHAGQYGYGDGFAGINDWQTWDGTGFNTDGDIGYFDVDDDNDYDQYYSNDISYPAGTGFYYEITAKGNDTANAYLLVGGYTLDDHGGSHNGWSIQEYFLTSYKTVKGYYDGTNPTESVAIFAKALDAGHPIRFSIDCLTALPSTSTGLQHDCSTEEGFTTLTDMTLSSDNDLLTFTATGGTLGSARLYPDTTSTVHDFDTDYYPFLAVNVSSVTSTMGWYLKAYYVGGSNAVLQTYTTDTGIHRYNLEANALGNALDFILIIVRYDGEYTTVFDFFKFYSIADYTVSLPASILVSYVLYVANGILIREGDEEGNVWISLATDFSISVNTNIYSIVNVTSNSTVDGVYDWNYREAKSGGTYHSDEEGYRFTTDYETLVSFSLLIYHECNISKITYIRTGILDVRIPTKSYRDLKFATMFDNTQLSDIDDYLLFTFLQDQTNAGLNITLTNDTCTVNNQEVDISDISLARIEVRLQFSQNSYKVRVSDENETKINEIMIYSGILKGINTVQIYSDFLIHSIDMYYLSGNIDYTTEWTKTESPHAQVSSDVYNSVGYGTTDNVEYHATYSRFVNQFQFLRTEALCEAAYIVVSHELPALIINSSIIVNFFHPNGSDFVRTIFLMKIEYRGGSESNVYHNVEAKIQYYDGSEWLDAYGIAGEDNTALTGGVAYKAKWATWRSTDNQIGLAASDDAGMLSPDATTLITTVSNYTLENLQANITISYDIIFFSVVTSAEVDFRFFAFELGEGFVQGVECPHFSTTWFTYMPIIGPIIEFLIGVFAGIGSAFDVLGELLFSAIMNSVLPAINLINEAVGALGVDIWGFFSGVLDNIYDGVTGVAAGIWDFFEGLLDNIYDGIGDIATNFAQWVGDGVSNVIMPAIEAGLASLLTVLTTLVITLGNSLGALFGIGDLGTQLVVFGGNVFLSIGTIISGIGSFVGLVIGGFGYLMEMVIRYGPIGIQMLVLFAVLDFSTAFASADENRIMNSVDRWGNVIGSIFGVLYRIFDTLVGFIGGIIP